MSVRFATETFFPITGTRLSWATLFPRRAAPPAVVDRATILARIDFLDAWFKRLDREGEALQSRLASYSQHLEGVSFGAVAPQNVASR